MPGWIPTPADRWLEHRLAITCKWPETLVVLDLRFWDDPIACDRRKRPSSRSLASTWGWGSTRVLRFIRAEDWKDEGRKANAVGAQEERNANAEGAQSERKSDADGAGDTPDMDEHERKSDAERMQEERKANAVGAQSERKERAAPNETRAQSPTPSQAHSPTHSPDEAEVSAASGELFAAAVTARAKPAAPAGPDDWQQAVDAWGVAKWGPVATREAKFKKKRLVITRKAKPGQALSARLGEVGLEEVIKVINWVFRSHHDRAQMLREKGYATPSTVFRASKFEDYHGFADEEDSGFRHRSGRHGDTAPPPPRQKKLSPDLLAELKAVEAEIDAGDGSDMRAWSVLNSRKNEILKQGARR
jgi:hypothetical protein